MVKAIVEKNGIEGARFFFRIKKVCVYDVDWETQIICLPCNKFAITGLDFDGSDLMTKFSQSYGRKTPAWTELQYLRLWR